MKKTEFDRIANEMLGHVLGPFGFTNKGTQHCTHYRNVGKEIYHVIMPSMGSGGVWYQIYVFPHSPAIYPLFERRFPDNLGIPTDMWSLLNEHSGISASQQQFNCKNEENFRRNFERVVKPLLLNVAIPYLDRFQSVADIIPAIRHPSFLGFALNHIGRQEDARIALQQERERLQKLDLSDKDVVKLLQNVERILNSVE